MEALKIIRDELPRGAQQQIAKNINVHYVLVNRVLNGTSDNMEVMTAIADYYSDYKKKMDEVSARLNALV